MTTTTPGVEYDMADLLTDAGCTLRGRNRADCPRCGAMRTVSYSAEVFCCHHAGCDFRGNAFTLARELGLARRLSPAEYRELCQERERADRAARALYERVQARRFEFLDELRGLNRVEAGAHEAGMAHPSTWDALALVYRERPKVLAELVILENSSAADLVRSLAATPEVREQAIEGVLRRGGLCDSGGRFVKVPF